MGNDYKQSIFDLLTRKQIFDKESDELVRKITQDIDIIISSSNYPNSSEAKRALADIVADKLKKAYIAIR